MGWRDLRNEQYGSHLCKCTIYGMFLSKLRSYGFLDLFYSLSLSPFPTGKHQNSTGIPLQRASAQSLVLFLLAKWTFSSRFSRQLYSFSLSSFISGLIPPHFPSLLIPSISWSSKSVSLSPRTATDGVFWQVKTRVAQSGESPICSLYNRRAKKEFLDLLSRAHQGWQSDGQILLS